MYVYLLPLSWWHEGMTTLRSSNEGSSSPEFGEMLGLSLPRLAPGHFSKAALPMASNGQSLQTGQTFTRRITHDTIGSDIVHPHRQRALEVLALVHFGQPCQRSIIALRQPYCPFLVESSLTYCSSILVASLLLVACFTILTFPTHFLSTSQTCTTSLD
jgi:hypothetical protein